ncbi:type VII secretion-associated serine protease mycosin [Amycolatopsis thermophila]|uniref:Membrane-anchored mycosin MYCP n=1 Tax=Amycolatopsis thermophila TaxID=206084 RepID=A0ABU0EQF1_9PSEU|nr:type VII secretion-associated serine protease mycosin [Amycolatopsis thermophila]MDQ0377518.1 membrane-anchored mycosin MYCP [Amycolatopsis thermophila]
MRTLGVPGRTATVLLAASIGVLATGTAQAQTGGTGSDGYWAVPPPYVSSYLPGDNGGRNSFDYQPKNACVTRDLGQQQVVLREKPWGQQYLQVDEAQQLVRAKTGAAGRGIRVAVIDTGVTRHPYLPNLEGGGDYVVAGDNGLNDCDGHGTEVAGIIAARTPADQIGFTGVAPDATIVSIRQSSQNYQKPDAGGATSGQQTGGRQQNDANGAGTTQTLAQAIVRAVNLHVDVINMSVDNCRPADGSITDGERAVQAAVRWAVDNNIVVVAAAGNTSESCPQNDQADPNRPRSIVTPPWFSDDVLSVAAIDENGGVAPFSVNGPWVSVAAPGTNIISLDPSKGSNQLANQTIENDKATPIQGTSFAAPYVAGVAALVAAQYPQLTARQIMNRIRVTAQHPGAQGGRDNFIGYGVVNPVAAVTAIVPSEEGVAADSAQQLPSGLPDDGAKDWTPMIVALAGTGGGLVVLLVVMFVMRTIRRTREAR